MNILLTGGTGYIGSHTAVVLTEAGHRVVLYDNLCNIQASVIESLRVITNQQLPFIEGNVCDTALLTSTLKTHEIDAVVHFAGLKAVGESVQSPIDYYDNNVGGSISLLKAMRTCNIKTLVFSSSATVYGAPLYLPLDEKHRTEATNPYGRSKLYIEAMLADVVASDSSWHVACLRYFNPVGAHTSGLIGENPKGVPNNLMPYIARVASGQLPYLHVYGDDYDTPDGTGIRDYVHVMDLAQGHVAALDFLKQQLGFHTFNLGTGKGSSVLEIVRAFELASGNSIPIQITTRRAGDVAACYAKVDKATVNLGWKATLTLDDMCTSTWKFQKN
jgi:UDP-glucose 4-epimerase